LKSSAAGAPCQTQIRIAGSRTVISILALSLFRKNPGLTITGKVHKPANDVSRISYPFGRREANTCFGNSRDIDWSPMIFLEG
jgi:hypothetical protein